VLLASTAPMRDQAGNVEGAVSVMQDITLLKSFEQERQELLSGASHDLQNMVTSIMGVGQMLKLQIADHSARNWDTTSEALDTIINTARRLSNQVDILMDIARNPVDRPFTLQRSPVGLVALATRVAGEYRPTTTRHTIQVVATDAEITGMFDELNLHSALANLVGNAIKFSPRGGTITIALKQQPDDGNNQVSIAVSDPGLGIPAGELAHVFDRHYRASNVAGTIPGTGLGLTGVQRTVTMHGGDIAIESSEGAGTTVTLRLPIFPVPRA
jgi:signal transduction histidine kinase